MINIDTNFPGGNIIVESIEGDTITLHQDLRDTAQWWFYWAFRVRGAAGRTLRFQFTNRNVFSALGPCYSPDGVSRQWLGAESVTDNGFSFTFPPDQDAAVFSFGIPYVQQHLQAFLTAHPAIRVEMLTRSEGGRAVEHLLLPSQTGRYKILLTARHHACEAMANYVMEGIFAFALSEEPEAVFLRDTTDLHAIPFMDKDGVERGDQGKARRGHDHNQDYIPEGWYASTRALMAQWSTWRGEFAAALDLHCPWIKSGRNDTIFFVGQPEPFQAPVDRLVALLAESQRGPLRFDPATTLPFGQEWNLNKNPMCSVYFRDHARLTVSLEFAYALASGQEVTADSTRAFGMDLGRALGRYLQEL